MIPLPVRLPVAAPAWTERDRLAALLRYDILDTPREEDFDDIARMAADICDTPIAVVNLISNDRQWFKAEVGLGVRSTPLDSSFCAQAILQPGLTIVPDATEDPRFSCNPLVTVENGIRFYAGALLEAEGGVPIGTVCVLDTRPRQLTGQQARTLERLSRQVMTLLELRRALRLGHEKDKALLAERDRQHVLMLELAHRVKNTLATVQAITTQTLRSAATIEEARPALSTRLRALGQATDVLVQAGWEGSEVGEAVQAMAALHGPDLAQRMVGTGPTVPLSPRAALALSLALHELATNAVKYGALSGPDGSVAITWKVEEENGEPSLRFGWEQRGGPPVALPSRRGFGTRLIEENLASAVRGKVRLDYRTEGLTMELTAPTASVQAGDGGMDVRVRKVLA